MHTTQGGCGAVRGCLIGCLAVVVLAVIAVVALGYLASEFDLIRAAEEQDALAFLGGTPVVMARVEPDHDAIISMLDLGSYQEPAARKFLQLFIPYEAGVTLQLDARDENAVAAAACSMRRGAGMFAWFLAHEDPPPSLGFGENIRAAEEQSGLLVLRTQWPTQEATRIDITARWAEAPETPLALEGGHIAEVVFDNRTGGAFLALEPALEAAREGQSPPLTPKMHDQVRAVLLRARWIRIRGDLVDRSETGPTEPVDPAHIPAIDAVVKIDVEAVSEDAAQEMLRLLKGLHETAVAVLRAEENVEVEGGFKREGVHVDGEFIVPNAARPLIKEMRRSMEKP